VSSAFRNLMERIAAEQASELVDIPAAGDTGDEPWPPGAFVVLTLDGAVKLQGRVAFTDGGWVHWAAVDGSFHATQPDSIQRFQ